MRKCKVYGIEQAVKVKGETVMDWRFSFDMDTDQRYWQTKGINNMWILSPLVSIGTAQALIRCLNSRSKQRGFFVFAKKGTGNGADDRLIKNCQQKLGLVIQTEKISLGKTEQKQIDMGQHDDFQWGGRYEEWKRWLLPFVQGKQLLLEELKGIRGFIAGDRFFQMLQYGLLLGEISVDSGVTSPSESGSKMICNRCGSQAKIHVQPCESCGKSCATCEECIVMGRSKTCSPLIQFKFEERSETRGQSNLSSSEILDNPENLENQLTPYQKKVAEHAVQFIPSSQHQELLIWAVTGAGKTEMIFPTIEAGIQKGFKILLASPRKDVIRELTPRFRKAFPNLPIVSLYGGSTERWNDGQLYLATTHQTMRFVQYFDLVIIDEMDAFPFHNDPVLHRVVRRALKSGGKMIFLTATPSEGWLDKVQRKEIDVAVLPIRYHGNPLPVPELKLISGLKKVFVQNHSFAKVQPLPFLMEFITQVKDRNGQAFIFVPEVRQVEGWLQRLRHWFPTEKIEGVSASDRDRDRKVELFRQGEIQFLVTTTIMERGVTVPNVHVLVLGADSQVFDEATLVQISGRVGRSASYPSGIVWFVAEVKTTAMKKAKQQIERLNKMAKEFERGK